MCVHFTNMSLKCFLLIVFNIYASLIRACLLYVRVLVSPTEGVRGGNVVVCNQCSLNDVVIHTSSCEFVVS